MRNDSVLPDPVPVVTRVGRAGPCRVDRGWNARARCRHGRPLPVVAPPAVGRAEQGAFPQAGAAEDPLVGVVEERSQRFAYGVVGERERGG